MFDISEFGGQDFEGQSTGSINFWQTKFKLRQDIDRFCNFKEGLEGLYESSWVSRGAQEILGVQKRN